MSESPKTQYPIARNASFKIKLANSVFVLVPLLPILVGAALGFGLVIVGGLVTALVMLPLFIWLRRELKRSKLEIGPSGMHFHGVLGKQPVHIPWESIVKIHVQPGKFGVVLDHPLDNPTTRQLAQANRIHLNKSDAKSSNKPQFIMAEQRWVPFDYFADWLWHGDMLTKLEQYSPHLASDCRASLAMYPNIGSSKSRWFLLIGVLFGLACFIAAGLWVASQIVPSEKIAFWLQLAALSVAYLIFAIFLVSMVPVLAFFAVSSVRNAIDGFRSGDFGEGLFSTALAVAQAGFAGWIGLALVSAGLRSRPMVPTINESRPAAAPTNQNMSPADEILFSKE